MDEDEWIARNWNPQPGKTVADELNFYDYEGKPFAEFLAALQDFAARNAGLEIELDLEESHYDRSGHARAMAWRLETPEETTARAERLRAIYREEEERRRMAEEEFKRLFKRTP